MLFLDSSTTTDIPYMVIIMCKKCGDINYLMENGQFEIVKVIRQNNYKSPED